MRRVLLAVALLLSGCAGAETYPYYHSGEKPPPTEAEASGEKAIRNLAGLGNGLTHNQ